FGSSPCLEFRAPGEGDTDGINLSLDRRRHLLLLFKEALTNVARHSHANRVTIDVRLTSGYLELDIEDDGDGFSQTEMHTGNGLRSLALRAKELKGSLEIDSRPSGGTTVRLRAPLRY